MDAPSEIKKPFGDHGEYSPVKLIGYGPYCAVWHMVEVGSGRDLAVKVLAPRFHGDDRRIDRMVREAKIAKSLSHSHIVPVHDIGLERPPYIVMDLMTGGNIGRHRAVSSNQRPALLTALAGVVEALAYIHDRGLVHCDVKPSNVLLDAAGGAYLSDFGMAARPDEIAEDGAFGGTVAYMSPEQFGSMSDSSEPANVDGRADVYSMGILLYELLTGEFPFKGSNRFAMMYERLKAPPRPPSAICADLPLAIDELVFRTIAVDPFARFQSARELAIAMHSAAKIR